MVRSSPEPGATPPASRGPNDEHGQPVKQPSVLADSRADDPSREGWSKSFEWVLFFTGGEPLVNPEFHDLAAAWQDIAIREKRLGIASGYPVLISGGFVDSRLGDYFRNAYSTDQAATARTYAIEMRTWFTFLDTRGLRWDEVESADVRAYQVWRVYDDRNPRQITPATWNKGWAALKHLYAWATREGIFAANPVDERSRLRGTAGVGGHREKNARASRDRWISPDEYAMWRDVGMRGYGATKDSTGRVVATLPDPLSRVRNVARNVAFIDYCLTSGLRLSEAGHLLQVEIPPAVGDEVPIIGKGRVLRRYRLMHVSGLRSLNDYLNGERRDAIRRGQRSGIYERTANRLDVAEIAEDRSGSRVILVDGRSMSVAEMTAVNRQRLYLTTDSGLEPAAIWLTESGRPMPAATWDKVFDAGNGRVTKARRALGIASASVKVTPHSLRFTFALFVLLAGIRAVDQRLALTSASPFDVMNYTQVFDEVRDLLGHANVGTTKRTYLAPVQGLHRSHLFRGGTFAEVWETLAGASPRIGFQQ